MYFPCTRLCGRRKKCNNSATTPRDLKLNMARSKCSFTRSKAPSPVCEFSVCLHRPRLCQRQTTSQEQHWNNGSRLQQTCSLFCTFITLQLQMFQQRVFNKTWSNGEDGKEKRKLSANAAIQIKCFWAVMIKAWRSSPGRNYHTSIRNKHTIGRCGYSFLMLWKMSGNDIKLAFPPRCLVHIWSRSHRTSSAWEGGGGGGMKVQPKQRRSDQNTQRRWDFILCRGS